jgi:integrase
MAYQFSAFRATKPVVRLIDESNFIYEVFFIVYSPDGTRTVRRVKAGINSLPPSQREKQAHATAQVLWEELQAGWNPLLSKYPQPPKEQPPSPQRSMSLAQAMEYALEMKRPHLSKYSFPDYRGTVRFMSRAAVACGLSEHDITSIQRRDIRLLVATAKDQNSWTPNARNKYLSLLQSLLSVLVDEEIIPFNPAHKIKNEPVGVSLGYRRITDDQKQIIAHTIMRDAPEYFDFLMFIYQDGIRRTELLQLRVSDVHTAERFILIRPEVAKTNRARRVPITNDILEILQRRQIRSLPGDWFLFSSDNFRAGPSPYHPNTPTSWWRRLVIDGLGIDCKMYSLKHKGADDKIKAGLDVDVLRTLYGHRSTQMTEVYAREVRNKYAQQIIDKAPEFARVVKMKKAK